MTTQRHIWKGRQHPELGRVERCTLCGMQRRRPASDARQGRRHLPGWAYLIDGDWVYHRKPPLDCQPKESTK